MVAGLDSRGTCVNQPMAWAYYWRNGEETPGLAHTIGASRAKVAARTLTGLGGYSLGHATMQILLAWRDILCRVYR
jgi:hypothetical protein